MSTSKHRHYLFIYLFLLFLTSVSPVINLQNEYYVGREKRASIYCNVEGYPPPTITWTPCDPQENVCNQNMLNISKVVEDCVYICKAKNSLGFDFASTKLCKLICLLKCFAHSEHHCFMVGPNYPCISVIYGIFKHFSLRNWPHSLCLLIEWF